MEYLASCPRGIDSHHSSCILLPQLEASHYCLVSAALDLQDNLVSHPYDFALTVLSLPFRDSVWCLQAVVQIFREP
jgi:hypothetical protein